LASKRETIGRRGSGRGQEIGRQFHFGLVSLSTDGSTSLKNVGKMGLNEEDRLDPFFYICLEAYSLILFFSRKKNKKHL
jgi:hypothetical protein